MAKIILVTGANRGIGFEICKELSEAGHTVLLTARNEAKGKEAAKTCHAQFFKLDLNDREDIEQLILKVNAKYDKIDVLINNAGIFDEEDRTAEKVSQEALRETIETNFFGPFYLTQLMLPLLRNSSNGRIINISSGLGAMNEMSSGYPSYRISKISLNAWTRILAAELSYTNIKVNSMCPGWVSTDMGGKRAPRPVEKGAETAIWLAIEPNIPTGKFFRDKKEIAW